jgi:parallel beta-helix repeat protein
MGNGIDNTITITASNVMVKGFTVTNGSVGIYASNANNPVVIQNNASMNGDGIHIRYSENSVIDGNIVGNNSVRGIFITNSNRFAASNNVVFNSRTSYGLNANASSNGIFTLNDVYDNAFDGIGLGFDTTNCTVSENVVHDNVPRGIWLDSSAQNNHIYDNSIVHNQIQVVTLLRNEWNNSVEGNFWSDYTGTDNNRDGIGDTTYPIGADNVDYHPLMGRFHSYVTDTGEQVRVVSNSSITGFSLHKSALKNRIQIQASNTTVTQTSGFCRVIIPHSVMVATEPYNVTVDGVNSSFINYTLYDDGDSRWIYFSYDQSTRTIVIEGTAPPDLVPPAIVITSPRNASYSAAPIALTFTVNEELSWQGYSLDSQANVTISGNTTLAGLSEGSHSIVLYGNDTSGNMNHSSVVQFTVDLSPPLIEIISPENKTYAKTSVSLNYSINEDTSNVLYSLDNAENKTLTGNLTFGILANGPHHITIYAQDLAGNTGISTVHFTIAASEGPSWPETVLFWVVIALAVATCGLIVLAYFLRVRKRKVKNTESTSSS